MSQEVGDCRHLADRVVEGMTYKYCGDCGAVAVREVGRGGGFTGWKEWHSCKACLLPGPYNRPKVEEEVE